MTTRRGVALVFALAVALAACGGSSNKGSRGSFGNGPDCVHAGGYSGTVSDHFVRPATNGTAIAVDAIDFAFAPTCTIKVTPGTVTLTVKNDGSMLHNVSVPSQHIDQDVAAGQTITVRVTVGHTPVVFFCKYHRGSGMVGALAPSS
jgi:plastocyanin